MSRASTRHLLSTVSWRLRVADHAAFLRHAQPFSSSASAPPRHPSEDLTLCERARSFFQFERPAANVFRTSNTWTTGQQSPKAAFGGLIMAQALSAAEQTMTDEFKPHSLHSYFILNVDTSKPVEYCVRLLRDGRSFKTRSVEAIQEGKVVFCLQASFHKPEADSCVHQFPYPAEVPPAEECPSLKKATSELLERLESGEIISSKKTKAALARYNQVDFTKWIFDCRTTDAQALFGFKPNPNRGLCFWVKSKVPLAGQDERIHRWLALFISDAMPVTSVVRPHAKNNFSVSMLFSLDHSMHFHHSEIRTDEWLLYEIESPIAAGGRGFARGRLWRKDGRLLASVSQEVLVRTKGEVSRIDN